ncbi:YjeF N-terminal domain-containing protein [Mycena albidolilacea]|uniref:NAD(P)H-hydrate epimerase n=1 Tax=Mycena albidolilacea TaxID=1033008 RepID=A0AAD7F3F3_9AGAR|nr:YjeF N-terminal domain-containing protein [Mycena albidolilacea]
MSLRYLSARLAQQIDDELMSAAGAFSLDQLMELAGLACAQTLAKVYGAEKYNRVLVCCGPGNQGGDGLVAARHLCKSPALFGYKPTIYMPKPGSKDIYQRLHTQCKNMSIPTLGEGEESLRTALKSSDVILDAIFGFSFKGPIRAPFDSALPMLSASGLPIVSVDIPSGWDVEASNDAGFGLNPDVLVSLTAPKEGVRTFRGQHFLGGRFVPRTLEEKFGLNLPIYPGYEQIVDITEATQKL